MRSELRGPSRLDPRAIILIHGFNNNIYDARESYRVFARNLRWESNGRIGATEPNSVPVIEFFWPGDTMESITSFGKAFSALAYSFQIDQARRSALKLYERMLRAVNPKKVVLISHSLGCRLVLEFLSLVARRKPVGFPEIEAVFLFAGAVPVGLAASQGDLLPPPFLNLKCEVWYSPSDWVLRSAFLAGQATALSWRELSFEAIGSWGRPPELGLLRLELFAAGHSDYWSSGALALRVANRVSPI